VKFFFLTELAQLFDNTILIFGIQVEYFNNYLRDPKRPQLPEHPVNKQPKPEAPVVPPNNVISQTHPNP